MTLTPISQTSYHINPWCSVQSAYTLVDLLNVHTAMVAEQGLKAVVVVISAAFGH